MVRSILRMAVQPEKEREFEEVFARLRVLARAQEAARMRGGELLRPLSGGPYVVTATWDRLEDYQVWLDSPVRAELGEVLQQFPAPGGAADLYEIVLRYGEDRERIDRGSWDG